MEEAKLLTFTKYTYSNYVEFVCDAPDIYINYRYKTYFHFGGDYGCYEPELTIKYKDIEEKHNNNSLAYNELLVQCIINRFLKKYVPDYYFLSYYYWNKNEK